jgi:hypothetical protein
VWRNRELEEAFPGLTEGSYQVTSPQDANYNCVAWAVGDTSRFWYEINAKGYYWPPGTGSADTIDGWKRVFEIHGYKEAGTSQFDPAFEKVAIYVDPDGLPSHVARQTDSRSWASKLGKGCDIEHASLDALEGHEYGKVAVIMQRRCKDGKRVRR